MKEKAMPNYLIYNEQTGTYTMDPEQAVRDDVEKHHWLHVLNTIIKDWRLYLMLVPMLFVFICWRYLPMYELLGCFKLSDESLRVGDQLNIGFGNFITLMHEVAFWRAFRNTFLLSFYSLLFGFPMPIILALFFNEIKSNATRSVMQVFTYLPKFMSTVVITTLLTMMLKAGDETTPVGILTQFLNNVGVATTEKGGFLYDMNFFRPVYVISGIWETAGYDSIVFFAAIIAISPTSYEAAQIDGAGKMQQMRYVVLPSILSTVVIMLITRIGSLLSIGYEKVLLLVTQGSMETADVVSTYAYGLGTGKNAGVASAAEMLNNIVGMLLVIGSNMIARKASDVSLY